MIWHSTEEIQVLRFAFKTTSTTTITIVTILMIKSYEHRCLCCRSAQLWRQTRRPSVNHSQADLQSPGSVWNTLTCQGQTLKKCFTLRYPSVHSPLRSEVVYNTTQVTGWAAADELSFGKKKKRSIKRKDEECIRGVWSSGPWRLCGVLSVLSDTPRELDFVSCFKNTRGTEHPLPAETQIQEGSTLNQVKRKLAAN